MDNSNRPSIRAYVGITGSGKGVSLRAHLAAEKPKRLLVWDPLGEYGPPKSKLCQETTSDLAMVAKRAGAAQFSVAYWPGPNSEKWAERFALFCRIAWSAGDCTVLVEELADVTKPSWAPPQWSRLTRQGRHRGLRLIGCTQRPASVDKNFLGQTTYVRVFMLSWPEDIKVMAKCVGAAEADVQALVTTEDAKGVTINYIELDRPLRKRDKGSIRLPRN